MKMYVVQHIHEVTKDCEDLKMIGVYSTQHMASSAVARMSRKPGFSSAAEGFHIDEYEVDRDYWEDGYDEW